MLIVLSIFWIQASGWTGSKPDPSPWVAGSDWPATQTLTSNDSTVSLHVTGDDVPIPYVALHSLLDFAHPKLIATITDPWRERELVSIQGQAKWGVGRGQGTLFT